MTENHEPGRQESSASPNAQIHEEWNRESADHQSDVSPEEASDAAWARSVSSDYDQAKAAAGSVRSSMPAWAQNAVTGNVREPRPDRTRRDAPEVKDGAVFVRQRRQSKGIAVSPVVIVAVCVVIVALVAALVIVTLAALSRTTPTATEPLEPIEVVDHRWDGLSWVDGRAVFEENGQVVSQTGVDVSDHQGWIDWSAVASDGVDFAYVRLGNRGYTEGALFTDEYYEYNVDAASDAGLDVGVYFFSQAIDEKEAREEAEFVLEKLAGRKLALPIAWDHERVADESGRANNLSRATLTACAQAFFEVIEAAGYETILYGNMTDLSRMDLEALGTEPLWLAEYGVSKPTPSLDLAMWQYTNSATVKGIDTPVDLDIRFTNVL